MSAEEVAKAFTQHFYTTLDTNVAGLASLYQPQSTLTFEGQTVTGADNIVQKYQSVGQVQHNVPQLTVDHQSCGDNNLLVFVTGQLQIGGQTQPLLFAHTFQLIATAPGNYYIHNELFRLIYG